MNQPHILPIEGSVNFRDIGGYATAEGLVIRPKQVYRSGTLSELTDLGVQQLATLKIGTIVDLRSNEERDKSPDRLPDGVRYLHRPITDPSRIPKLRTLWTVFWQRNDLGTVILDVYKRIMLDANGAIIGEILDLIAENNGAVLIHCTAGKDRTGLFIALLLTLLDIPASSVMQDYAVSNQFTDVFANLIKRDISVLRRVGLSDEQIRPIISADPPILNAALQHIDDRYGSLANYLNTQAGIDAAKIKRLQQLLLTQQT